MNAKLIDGKSLSESIKNSLKIRCEEFETKYGRKPGLAVIKVGNDPASEVYVRNKILACEYVGVKSFSYILPEATQGQVLELIDTLNSSKNVDGILVQLPLPTGLDEKELLARISPDKDADGFHAVNAGRLLLGLPCAKPCTPAGIIELIRSTGESIEGKHAVVVGRSNIVGKPAAILLLAENATVTICHSKTPNLSEITRQADILVAAVGRKEFIRGDMIKSGSIVIDVGMNRSEGKLFGDVCFSEAVSAAAYITPVPGGVGPMTVAMLIKNTVDAAFKCKKS